MQIISGSITEYIYFVAVDSTDLKTRKTGLSSFTVYRSRNGGTATIYTTPTITELSAANMPGVYVLLIDEDTTITTGKDSEEYCVHITQASMAAVTRVIQIIRPKATEGTTITTTNIDATITSRSTYSGGAVASVTGAVTVGTNNDKTGYSLTQVFPTNFSVLSIDSNGYVTEVNVDGIKKNTALSNFEFLMVDATDGYTEETGLTVTAQRSIDGAAFGACANSVTEVSNGMYKINLAAADLNGDVITLRFSATGARTRLITMKTNT